MQSTGKKLAKPLLPPSGTNCDPTDWARSHSPDKTSLVPGPTIYLSLIIENAITTGQRPWRTIHHSDHLHSEFTKEPISSELPAAALAKQILAHPPTCATPLNKLAGFPMPRSLGRLGDSPPISSSPVAKELDDRRALLDIACVGLSFAEAPQVAHRGCARPDWAPLARHSVFKDPNKSMSLLLCLTLTASPSPQPKDRTIMSCGIRLKTTTRNQGP